jgi:membrane protein implicated in regulation of membrane protease activity
MLVFILILLLIAALAGVFLTVLKVALIIVLSVVLSVIILGAIAYSYGRYRFNRFRREVERHNLPPAGAP